MYADLHLHTTASDGKLTPAQVVAKAKKLGYQAIAITDHDTVSGLPEALAEGEKQQIEVIPGIEFSTISGEREIHILGYYVDINSTILFEKLTQFIEARENRAVKMVEKLNDFGIKISLPRVKEIAGNEFIGRPHIAQALLEQGYIKELKEAFTEQHIGRGGRAYVERFKLSPQEGITLLKQAGAVPVLAHPGYLSSGPPLRDDEITPLIESGLKGIEAIYSRHSNEQQDIYTQIALKYNCLVTGGSDSHGHYDEPNSLGSIKLPYRYVTDLKKVH